MSKEVKSLEEALEVLKAIGVTWITTNKIQNSLWVKGIAFFNSSHCRVAFYDEAQNILSIKY